MAFTVDGASYVEWLHDYSGDELNSILTNAGLDEGDWLSSDAYLDDFQNFEEAVRELFVRLGSPPALEHYFDLILRDRLAAARRAFVAGGGER